MKVSVFFLQQVKAGVEEARVLGLVPTQEEDEMGPGHQASFGLCSSSSPSALPETCSPQTYQLW